MPQDNGGASVQCCASVSDPGFGAVLNAVAQVLEESSVSAVSFAVVTSNALLAARVHRLRAPPPNPYSYYVRSARILR